MSAPLLELQAVTRRFGGLVAVNELGFSMAPGEVVALLGPNGSGKTTAMNLISGALACHGGQIRFQGRAIESLPSHQRARLGIARTFQLVRVLPEMSCLDNVAAGMAFRPGGLFGASAQRSALQLLERVGISALAGLPASELTYIDQKRLELARALALEPALLLLDEWLAGLNPTELQQGIALIASLGRDGLGILLVEHVMDAVHALCSRAVVMNAGRKIADGPTGQVLRAPAVVQAYLGDEPATEAQHA
jgi:branched-chain amino acid transport system ATP-binding protein